MVKFWLPIVCVGCLCQSSLQAALTGYDFLFDLSIDPYESVSLLDDPSYADAVEEMKALAAVYQKTAVYPDVPDETSKKTTWKKEGGVVPWIDDTTTRDIEELYLYHDAPHIVFFLVDDWGYNDVGYRSTYLNWTTPTIDRLAAEGVKLENYYTNELCTPSRGAFLTGRYAFRYGLADKGESGELPLTEATLAEELKSAGYATYLVGKWHLGLSSYSRTPLYRGFDYFYGYYNGFVDYWTKQYGDYLDLQNGLDLETDEDAISEAKHNAYLIQEKAEAVIRSHAQNNSHQPMFLFYSAQLVHEDWAAPDSFISRCTDETSSLDEATYCAMNVMVDEVVANLTCVLEEVGFSNNTILIISSDNGGTSDMPGTSHPFRGSKGSVFRGGLSNTAFIHSTLLPESVRGTSYNHLLHITDWLPTIMGIATNGRWEGSIIGNELDGFDVWENIKTNTSSDRTFIINKVEPDSDNCSVITVDGLKLELGLDENSYKGPEHYFTRDRNSDLASMVCANPSLMHSSETEWGVTDGSDETDDTKAGDDDDDNDDNDDVDAEIDTNKEDLEKVYIISFFDESVGFSSTTLWVLLCAMLLGGVLTVVVSRIPREAIPLARWMKTAPGSSPPDPLTTVAKKPKSNEGSAKLAPGRSSTGRSSGFAGGSSAGSAIGVSNAGVAGGTPASYGSVGNVEDV